MKWIVFAIIGFISLHSPKTQLEIFSNFVKKTPQNTPINSQFYAFLKPKNRSLVSENSSWKAVSLFNTDGLTLYQSKNNPNILISVQKEKGISMDQIQNKNRFLKQVEEEKLITLSTTSIKNRKVSSSRAKTASNTILLWTKGAYLDFQKKTVFFKDFNFYHNKATLHILIHNTQVSTKQETQTIYTFIDGVIHSETSLSKIDKKEFLSLMEQIKNDNS